jgi:hypothetical protein
VLRQQATDGIYPRLGWVGADRGRGSVSVLEEGGESITKVTAGCGPPTSANHTDNPDWQGRPVGWPVACWFVGMLFRRLSHKPTDRLYCSAGAVGELIFVKHFIGNLPIAHIAQWVGRQADWIQTF